ncbi:MAG: starch-binding outer membrane protein SusE/F [Tenuifilum sp.]|jgi:hypothetical protein|uniref:SusF/SusE family outer membrane protein n=1 Tax=Tenuifilum sp. TaxID=2760880 RepID=UPI0024ABADC4|nr:SusF/SusE family outer membrane protein [Tenuifilum sp.]MDI3527545.1 starch-binding outer membrane protein SusE/F [Tenuifilum sp.]
MISKLSKYLGIVGILSIFASCEKDGEIKTMLSEPISPTFVSIPEMEFYRTDNPNQLIEFKGTPVDPGFNASATYFLEIAVANTSFENPVTLYSGVQDTLIQFKLSDLNAKLLSLFDGDVVTDAELRLRAVLVVDAGTGAPGTGSSPFEYFSTIAPVKVRPFGLPRLDLVGTGYANWIESPDANGVYSGFVKLNSTEPFTLKNPDDNKVYGLNAGRTAIVENGTESISSDADGWYKLTVNINDGSFSLDAHMYGVVGSATPNGWGAPDIKMDYNRKKAFWEVTTDLAQGEIKFRKNDGWAWNLGLDGNDGKLKHDGPNIPVPDAGTYYITLTITQYDGPNEAGVYTLKKIN